MAPPDLVFGAAIAFLLGVLSASMELNFFISLGVVIATLILGTVAFKRTVRSSPFLAALAIPFVFGFMYYSVYMNFKEARAVITYDAPISFSGVVRGEPRLTERSQQFRLILDPPLLGEITIITSPFPEFEYGDALLLSGKITPRDRVEENARSIFPDIALLKKHQGFWLKEALLDLKGEIVAGFRNSFSPDEAALISGLTLGIRSDFGKTLYDEMRRSGTTHLVALSGYNIAILVSLIYNAIGTLARRRITFIVTTLIIFLFVLMVGGEASVVRAAIMGFLLLLTREIGRPYHFRNAVTLTAVGMTLVEPTIVRFDLGFALSFASLLGIVYLNPVLASWFGLRKKDESILNWRENMVTTISAQLAVLPILSSVVGNVSLSSFLANTAILPFVPPTMAIGFLLGGLSLVALPLGFLLVPLLTLFLSYEIAVIKFFANIPFAVTIPASLFFMFCYYGVMILFVAGRGEKSRERMR